MTAHPEVIRSFDPAKISFKSNGRMADQPGAISPTLQKQAVLSEISVGQLASLAQVPAAVQELSPFVNPTAFSDGT
jgi:hypothetical protein